MDKVAIQQGLYFASWLVIPFILYVIWRYQKSITVKSKLGYAFFLLGAGLFTWARFIEPQLILVHQHQIKVGLQAKIVVISDIHLGIYKKRAFLKRVVNKINQLKQIDAVLIAGDLTYHPQTDLNQLFSPLKQLKVPVYAVLGNHDSQAPGPDIRAVLKAALAKQKVHLLDNQMMRLKGIYLVGLGSHWAGDDDLTLLQSYQPQDPVLVLLHNPSTTLDYTSQQIKAVNLTIAGHTHGGQVRIPLVYKWVLSHFDDFDKDLHQTPNGAVFVTSGMGEMGLPLRFLIPPVIDVLTLM